MKLRTLQIFSSYREWHSPDHGRLSAVHRAKHSLFSMRWHSQDHGRLPVEHMSKHSPFSWRRHPQDHGRSPTVHVAKHLCENLQLLGLECTKHGTSLKTSWVATEHSVKHWSTNTASNFWSVRTRSGARLVDNINFSFRNIMSKKN